MLVPYIGITDFMNFQQVQDMLESFEVYRRQGSKRVLHIGVMMSYKTLHDIPSRWQNAFPPKETIASIFSSTKVYNCLHYADYENGWPNFELGKRLERAIAYGGQHIHALQLDMIWPHPSQILLGVHSSRKDIEVILQIGRKALDEIQNDPQLLVEKLRDYGGTIHRVLLDKSGGKGIGMNAIDLYPFAQAIRESCPELGLVVAGGLGPERVYRVRPLAEKFPDVSIDAQGWLRPSGDALDPIDWNMAREYLKEALAVLL